MDKVTGATGANIVNQADFKNSSLALRRSATWRRPRFVPRLAGATIAWTVLVATGLSGQQPKATEYQVKAAYLYNFGRFVKWPAKSAAAKDESFTVCVLGPDPFGQTLDSTLAGEALDGKPVEVRRISRPQQSGDCRILFISSAEESHLKDILLALDQVGVLTVSDMADFTRRGGMIQFVSEAGKIRFEINLANAESAKLVLSSELLKVAAAVRRNARPGDSN
jgi:hypothetical protein